jgi:hypothetical protein
VRRLQVHAPGRADLFGGSALLAEGRDRPRIISSDKSALDQQGLKFRKIELTK